MAGNVPREFAGAIENVFAGFAEPGPVTHTDGVAEATWNAVNDPSVPMRIPARKDALAWAAAAGC